MERLEPSVHHLGKPGDGRHIGDRQVRLAKEFGGPAGADQLDAEFLVERGGEFLEAGFVGNGNQGTLDGNEVGHG